MNVGKLHKAVDRLMEVSSNEELSVACRVAILDVRDAAYEHPAVEKLEDAMKRLEKGMS